MKILKLQVKGEGVWQSRKELFLYKNEEISLITDRGRKVMEEDIERGRTGFCHLRFKANILLEVPVEIDVAAMQPGDRLVGTEVVFIVQRVGKNCHSNCPIYSKAGCSLQEEILFLEVNTPGKIEAREKLTYREKDV